jgi:2-oxoglutarate dehydrogenase E2 component (dihydrolipoamide succinyltransferase)
MVKLPQMGEGVHEATLIKWFKKPGDKIQKDEPLLEVATDKVDTEIVAPASGYLIAIFVKAGELISVQQDLAQISSDPKATPVRVSAPVQKHSSTTTQARVESASSSVSYDFSTRTFASRSLDATYAGPVRSSPLVRKIARESGVPLGDITGTGHAGRIHKEDVYRHLSHLSTSSQKSNSIGFQWEDALFKQKTDLREGKEYLDGVEVQRSKMTRIRRLTAEHMLRSVRISPHVTTTFEVDLGEVARAKRELDESFQSQYASKLSYTAFFIHACVGALKEHPMVNASVDGDDILLKERINIACAVATEQGLIVPVLKDLNECSLFETAQKLNDIVKRAREKRLHPEEVQGGTFSITNPGIYGSLHSQPIINQPQVAILSTGAIIERPAVMQGEILVRPLIQIGLTFDHRVVDGEGGAKFLSTIKRHLESFSAQQF